MVDQVIKIEKQLKRKGIGSVRNATFNSQSLKYKTKKEGASSSKEETYENKGKTITHSSSVSTNKNVKYFKCQDQRHIASECPTKRTMLMEENEEIVEEEDDDYEEDLEEDEEEIPSEDLLMVRRMLGNQIKEEDTSQRENLFHIRCLVQGKVCSLIIGGGSCINVAITRLVSKLNLEE